MQLRSLKIAMGAALALAAVPASTQQAPAPLRPAPAAPATIPAPPPGVATLTKADVDAWLDGYMPYALNRGAVAGAVVVVVKDGQVVTQRGFGYSDVAARKPVDPETTLFRPGSVSKLVTWTAVMQLVEQAKIDLDADINTYLDYKIPPRDGKPVTMRNLMTHTAGFEEAIRGLITANEPPPQLGKILKRWVPERIFAPGATPAYSNYATALAGYVVERVSGQSFDDYLDRNIFGRTGMTRSSFRQPLPAALQPLMSKGYALSTGEPKPYEIVGPAPAGSLAASGADMGRFMLAHLGNGGPLLKPETARLMHNSTLTILPEVNRMALGFYEKDINGLTAIAHGGDTQWFHSYLWLFPERNTGVYVSMNSAGKDGASGAIRTALFEGFADRYFPAPNTDKRVDAVTAKKHAEMLVGTYTNSRRSDSSFFRALDLVGQVKIGLDADGGPLVSFATNLGDQPRKWVEIAPFVWRDAYGHERLAAKVENGKVVMLSFDEISPFMMFQRVPWYLSSAWLLPMLLLGLGVLTITALSWPVGAIARRRYGAKLAFTGNDLKAYRLVRGFAATTVAVLIGWAVALGTMMSDFAMLSGALDWLVWLLQITGIIAFFGMLGIAIWNLWLVWKGKRGWFSRVWSVLIVLSAFFTLWVAIGFRLISFGTNY